MIETQHNGDLPGDGSIGKCCFCNYFAGCNQFNNGLIKGGENGKNELVAKMYGGYEF